MSGRHKMFLSAAVAALVSSALYAEPTTTSAVPDYVFTLGGGANYSVDTDLREAGGSFSVYRADGSVRMDHAFTPQTALSVTFDGEWSHYFFRNFAAVPGNDGSDSLDLYQFDLRPTLRHAFDDQWSVFGGFTLTASGMAEATLGESLSYGLFGGVNYQLSPTVSIGLGAAVVTQLEDDPFFVPLITAKWDITPDLSLTADGLGAKLTYKFDPSWSVYVGGHYDYRQFRLDADEIIRKGVLTDQAVPVTVGVTYDFGNTFTISAEAGVVAWRRLEFTDAGGNDAGADEADPAAFVSVQARYSF